MEEKEATTMNTNQLEMNIMESFRLVKTDVVTLQKLLAMLSQNQEQLLHQVQDTREKEISLYHRMKDVRTPITKVKPITKTIHINVAKKLGRKRFVASKTGSKFHALNCVFAKNIKPKSKVVFKTKNRALNLGLKACDCVKRV